MKKLALILTLALSGTAYADCESISLPSNLTFSEYEDCDSDTGLAVIMDSKENYGFYNMNAEKVEIKPQYQEAWSFQEGLALIKKDDKWGYIKTDGSFAIKPTYDDGWGFSDGLAKVQKGDKFGFINAQNQVIIPIKYEDSHHWFNDGFGSLKQNGKWALVDKKGKVLTKFEYDLVGVVSEGRILVNKDVNEEESLYGFLDTKGKLVIPLTYDYASSFEDGVSLVMKDDDIFPINIHGKRVEEKEDYTNF